MQPGSEPHACHARTSRSFSDYTPCSSSTASPNKQQYLGIRPGLTSVLQNSSSCSSLSSNSSSGSSSNSASSSGGSSVMSSSSWRGSFWRRGRFGSLPASDDATACITTSTTDSKASKESCQQQQQPGSTVDTSQHATQQSTFLHHQQHHNIRDMLQPAQGVQQGQQCSQPFCLPQAQHLYQYQQQMYQQVQLAAVEQLHLQQLQFVPFMVPAVPAAANPAEAAGAGAGVSCPQQPGYCNSLQTLDPSSYHSGGFIQLPYPPGFSAAAAAHGFQGMLNPALGFAAGSPSFLPCPGSSSSSSRLWNMVWAVAAAAMLQKTQQQQQQQQRQQPASGAAADVQANTSELSAAGGLGLSGIIAQQCGTYVHAAAALLLYVLVCIVVSALTVQQRAKAAVSWVAAVRDACTAFVQQQAQLFVAASAGTAAAADVAQLRQMLELPGFSRSNSNSSRAALMLQQGCQATAGADSGDSSVASSNNSSSNGGASSQASADASSCLQPVAAGRLLHQADADDDNAIAQQQQQQQQRQQRRRRRFACGPGSSRPGQVLPYLADSVSSLFVVLGLYCGVLVWISRWLLLQAPAATGQAVASTCQQGLTAAEGAADMLMGRVVRVAYGLAWVVCQQLRGMTIQLVQSGYRHSTVAAQQACFCALWCIDFVSGDRRQQRSAVGVLVVQVLQTTAAAAGRCGQWWFGAAEVVATAVAAKLLRDASPVTQTAVWGLAGMLKRNVAESCTLCWQLLLQLSQVYMMQQQAAAEQSRG